MRLNTVNSVPDCQTHKSKLLSEPTSLFTGSDSSGSYQAKTRSSRGPRWREHRRSGANRWSSEVTRYDGVTPEFGTDSRYAKTSTLSGNEFAFNL